MTDRSEELPRLHRPRPGTVVDAVEADADVSEGGHDGLKAPAPLVRELAIDIVQIESSLLGDRMTDQVQVHS